MQDSKSTRNGRAEVSASAFISNTNSIILSYAGFQSRFISIPSKPTLSHRGDNVTFTWRYHLSHADRAHFKRLVFGLWKNGDISTPLMTVSKNGSLVSYSNRVVWLGNRSVASFRLHSVCISDNRVFGCKLDFGAFTVLDSVRLNVIGKHVAGFAPRFKVPFCDVCHYTNNHYKVYKQ